MLNPDLHLHCGYSAHAEIDLDQLRGDQKAIGLLRARGDRPWIAGILSIHPRATPRTRRSTRIVSVAIVQGVGYSAHAEIDPLSGRMRRRRSRLLRARGDRPVLLYAKALSCVATPRTRRSTPAPSPRQHRPEGYSAHAEIDLRTRLRPASSSWLLRARGDRPGASRRVAEGLGATPRTRRSTAGRRRGVRRWFGYSAHAEIDPRDGCRSRCCRRLLHARGDRPRPNSSS